MILFSKLRDGYVYFDVEFEDEGIWVYDGRVFWFMYEDCFLEGRNLIGD